MKAFRIWRVHEAVCGRPDGAAYRLRGWGGSNHDAACRYLETIGEEAINGTLRHLVSAHDEMSGALSERPLA